MQVFNANVVKDEAGRLTYIELPFDARNAFNKHKGTIFVSGIINDIAYRGKLLSRGGNRYIMTIDKVLQKAIRFCGEPLSAHITMSLEEVDSHSVSESVPSCVYVNMDLLTVIKTRRSIRKFTSEPITDEILNTILQVGLYAPSAKNKRPYHFVVIRSRDILAELSHNNSNASMLDDSACAVLVCGDSNIEGMKEFLYADCAAATQNMLLCIHGLGLGGVWCGVAANSEWYKLIVDKLHLPLKIVPIAVIALGYPDEEKLPCERWESVKIHFDKW